MTALALFPVDWQTGMSLAGGYVNISASDMPTPGVPYGKFGGETSTLVKVTTDSFVKNIRIEVVPFYEAYQSGKSQRRF
jgi:hypothetical protein